MKKIIKNGTIVTASDTYRADIEINDGVITSIGNGFTSQDAEVIDAEGYDVFPGGIDPHTHLDMPLKREQGRPLSVGRQPLLISV